MHQLHAEKSTWLKKRSLTIQTIHVLIIRLGIWRRKIPHQAPNERILLPEEKDGCVGELASLVDPRAEVARIAALGVPFECGADVFRRPRRRFLGSSERERDVLALCPNQGCVRNGKGRRDVPMVVR